MPELIEAELYAEALRPLAGARLERIELRDPAYLRPPGTPAAVLGELAGARLDGVRRHGKVVLIDLGEPSAVLGLRFGMTGRLIVGDTAPIQELVYSSSRDERTWDRVVLRFDGVEVAVRDPRRLGSIELDPDTSMLGPDAASLTVGELRHALAGRRLPLKAALLDQKLISGLGNLLVDETLWRSGMSPVRPAGGLDPGESRRLARGIRSTVGLLTRRGGSHTGDTFEARAPGALCPRDGAPMRREPVGGRTTYWCPAHQR